MQFIFVIYLCSCQCIPSFSSLQIINQAITIKLREKQILFCACQLPSGYHYERASPSFHFDLQWMKKSPDLLKGLRWPQVKALTFNFHTSQIHWNALWELGRRFEEKYSPIDTFWLHCSWTSHSHEDRAFQTSEQTPEWHSGLILKVDIYRFLKKRQFLR